MTITIHYLRFAISGDGVLKGFNAKARFHAVREPPSQNLSAELIHDGNQIQKTPPHRDVADVDAPNLIGPGNRQTF
ncbi:hypothetical protein [Celeribacter halophilus]|uniref:hypothetical protein n=1 Tax=Celeribacter halophilus TaxID=576117 RepID=UPI0011144E2F